MVALAVLEDFVDLVWVAYCVDDFYFGRFDNNWRGLNYFFIG